MLGTSEIFVGTSTGVVPPSAFKRLPLPNRYSLEILNTMQGVPWRARPSRPLSATDFEGEVTVGVQSDPVLEPTLQSDPALGSKRKPARHYIRRDVELQKYGNSENCPGCAAALWGQ